MVLAVQLTILLFMKFQEKIFVLLEQPLKFLEPGPWTWNCLGAYGGNNDSCLANKKIDVSCGSAMANKLIIFPLKTYAMTILCLLVSGTGPWIGNV
jgi:hypothetical protein